MIYNVRFAFYLFITIGPCEAQYICDRFIRVNDSLEWEDANKACQRNNGRLLNLNQININELESCSESFNGTWIDRYAYFSPWIEIIGCHSFRDDFKKALKRYDTFNNNEPGKCADFCSDVKYFGLKGEICFCFNPEVWLSVSTTEENRCNTSCYGNTYLSCGGFNSIKSISIYRKVHSGKVMNFTSKDNFLCAIISCFEEHVNLYSQNCSFTYPVVCTDKTSSLTSLKWKNAVEHCKKSSYVPYPSDNKLCIDRTVISAIWSGVFRTRLIGNLDTHSNLNEKRLACFKIIQKSSGYEVVEVKCHDRNAVICQKKAANTDIIIVIGGVVFIFILAVVVILVTVKKRENSSGHEFVNSNVTVSEGNMDANDHSIAKEQTVPTVCKRENSNGQESVNSYDLPINTGADGYLIPKEKKIPTFCPRKSTESAYNEQEADGDGYIQKEVLNETRSTLENRENSYNEIIAKL